MGWCLLKTRGLLPSLATGAGEQGSVFTSSSLPECPVSTVPSVQGQRAEDAYINGRECLLQVGIRAHSYPHLVFLWVQSVGNGIGGKARPGQ